MKTRAVYLVVGLVSMVALASACGGDASSSVETLPLLVAETITPVPLETTTTLSANPEFYTIQQGDTLSAIAAAFGVSVEDIVALNSLDNADAIQAGQKLSIPTNAVAPTTTTAVATAATGSSTTMAP